jgi:membrane-associated protein
MEFITWGIDLFLHLDKHLGEIITQYGFWTYAILFLIIFCETGLVVTPFLPGDSLLFAVGAFCALGVINLGFSLLLISLAAIIGDSVNYSIGSRIGLKAFSGKIRFLKKEHLEKTQNFYDKHGGKTIIIARFIPIIRTFAPFVAGVGTMKYFRFFSFNVIGGILWTVMFILGGYLFGNIPFIKNNFSVVILAIIIISVLPGFIEYFRSKRKSSAI